MHPVTYQPILPALRRLRVYPMTLSLASLVFAVPLSGDLRSQCSRAMRSVVLNTAEGAGQTTRRGAVRYFGIARGSLCEVTACLDCALAGGVPVGDDVVAQALTVDTMLRGFVT